MARGRELEGVAQQVDEDLAQADGVAAHLARQVRRQQAEEFEPLLRGRQAQGAHGFFDGRAQVEGAQFQFELPGLDLGQVQDAVDEVQQGFGGRLDDVQGPALLRREPGVQDHVRHADDGVHGRADFVAEIGQELGFHVAGGFGLASGCFQFGHQLLQARFGLFRVVGCLFSGHEAGVPLGAPAFGPRRVSCAEVR